MSNIVKLATTGGRHKSVQLITKMKNIEVSIDEFLGTDIVPGDYVVTTSEVTDEPNCIILRIQKFDPNEKYVADGSDVYS